MQYRSEKHVANQGEQHRTNDGDLLRASRACQSRRVETHLHSFFFFFSLLLSLFLFFSAAAMNSLDCLSKRDKDKVCTADVTRSTYRIFLCSTKNNKYRRSNNKNKNKNDRQNNVPSPLVSVCAHNKTDSAAESVYVFITY